MITEDYLFGKCLELAAKLRHADDTNRELLEELEEERNSLALARAREQKTYDNSVELEALRKRVTEMAPQKQFRIIMRPYEKDDAADQLQIDAVQSANGETVIFVLRPQRFCVKGKSK